jgi:hypothetical protein
MHADGRVLSAPAKVTAELVDVPRLEAMHDGHSRRGPSALNYQRRSSLSRRPSVAARSTR